MVATTYSASLHGIDGRVIQIQAAASLPHLPGIHITGLPGDIVRESRERVRVCLGAHGFDVPSSKVNVHLLPADAKKQGSQFDVGIALAILSAEKRIPETRIRTMAFLGELSLDGKIGRVAAALSLIECLDRDPHVRSIVLPQENEPEAALFKSSKLRLAETLGDILRYILKDEMLRTPKTRPAESVSQATPALDFVQGHRRAKRALQIALAGRHHLLFMGAPGAGKSMLAHCAPSLLPALSNEDQIRVAKNYGLFPGRRTRLTTPPFRCPHPTISSSGLLGGGTGTIVPGEVTLADSGVLFLDEFPEFRRDAIEGLREPLQSGVVHLHRVGHALRLPARFTLLAAMNPCPCGYSLEARDSRRHCSCSPERIAAYRKRISGPILDRMDLIVPMTTERTAVPIPAGLSHREIRESIVRTFERQTARFGKEGRNGDWEATSGAEGFQLDEEGRAWLEESKAQEDISHRAYFKIIKTARTIADLEGSVSISLPHLREAKSFRLDESAVKRPW